MPLKDLEIKQAKATDRDLKLSDGGGLHLLVTTKGGKYWRLAYRFDSKQKTLALGVYPAVSLKEAREKREEAKKRLAAGVDPHDHKRREKLVAAHARNNTFRAIAAELLDKKRREGKAEATLTQVSRLCGLANETIGDRPIAEIEAPEILMVLKRVEARGATFTAHRTRTRIGEVFRYAVATGRAKYDPTQALKGALLEHKTKNFGAIVQEKPFGGLLRAIADYQGAPETKYALDLLTLTFVRSYPLRHAAWSQFDLSEAVWNIPAENMKGVRGKKEAHFVPLAPQAVTLLRQLHAITGGREFLFPGRAGRPMSENTINAALRRMGFTSDEMTGHGFRSSASSILNESNLWNRDAIETQLAHEERNAVRKAYARGEYWDERVRMMGWWADVAPNFYPALSSLWRLEFPVCA